jgi:hypothetical protein
LTRRNGLGSWVFGELTALGPRRIVFSQKQVRLTSAVGAHGVDAWAGPGVGEWDRREALRRNDAIFSDLTERAVDGDAGYENALLDKQLAEAPAVSMWEDLTAAVRSIFDDLTGQG